MLHLSRLAGAALLALALAAPAAAVPEPALAPSGISFPKDFMWGAATAAHQVEGRLANDWGPFEAKPGNVANGDTSEVGVDHLRRYDEDFGLAADMGHNVHRLSVEWSRIEPERGRWDHAAIEHYHRVFASLKRQGLKPMVTLHHFTNPRWVASQGGWLNPRTVMDFSRFAGFMAREFGAEVDWWVTINEPNVYAFQSHYTGAWPPMRRDGEETLKVLANMVAGHAGAYRALKGNDTSDVDGDGEEAVVGLAQHIAIYDPFVSWSPLDHLHAYFTDDVFNRAFLRAVSTGEVSFGFPGVRGVHTRNPAARASVDFIGVNYYTRWRCATFGPAFRLPTPGAPTNALGWEIYPKGIYRALAIADEYTTLPDGRKVPLVITENGIDDRDVGVRSAYLVQHVREVARAIEDGMDVRGYVHWTLMDNFEWSEGYAPRFGLYTVDRSPGAGLKRVPTPAVATFKAIATANKLSAELLMRYRKLPSTTR